MYAEVKIKNKYLGEVAAHIFCAKTLSKMLVDEDFLSILAGKESIADYITKYFHKELNKKCNTDSEVYQFIASAKLTRAQTYLSGVEKTIQIEIYDKISGFNFNYYLSIDIFGKSVCILNLESALSSFKYIKEKLTDLYHNYDSYKEKILSIKTNEDKNNFLNKNSFCLENFTSNLNPINEHLIDDL